MTEQPTIPGHVHTLGWSETTFHKIVTHIGGPKKLKIRGISWKMGFCSLLWQRGLEKSLGVLYIYCRALRYRLNDVEILKIQLLFQEL